MPQLIWLVTGCSSGIGEAFVTGILSRGDKVIGTCRNDTSRLKHLQDAGAKILQLDITASQESLGRTIQQAIEIYGRIDVLVNNAGYLESGMFEEVRCSSEKFLDQFQTNVLGAANVTRVVLLHFRKNRSGVIAFMGSLAGWAGVPGASAYCATKFAIAGLSDCIRQETAHLGIHTIVFDLGFFRTKIMHSDNLKWSDGAIEEYQEVEKGVKDYFAATDGSQPGDPKLAVEVMIDVVKSEGSAEGKEMPHRLPLGADALAVVQNKCSETLEVCKKWESVIVSTGFKE